MKDTYSSPLCGRYASREMREIFSDDTKFSTWRKLWIALAESEKELGLDITDAQIEEMKNHIFDIDYEAADKYESELRHDVMAHIRTYGDVCPSARGIIHLGATSCYVGDNTDIILHRKAMERVRVLIVNCIKALSDFAERYKSLPTLAYTHFQAAQPTTVGKRATLWINDLILDLERLDFELEHLKFFGCKGTTGTAASFFALFDGDHEKVKRLEKLIAEKMGFDKVCEVSGQTYTRKIDFNILSVLSGIAQSASKFAGDIRLLSHLKEFDEPFESGQVGSSAMAYKRNPMRSERIASLSRYVISDLANPAFTAASQWLERTLDDSANRRIAIPEAFLAIDGILSLYYNVISGVSVYPSIIKKHLNEELPFMATENILMHCVKKGGDRQALHEEIRRLSVETAKDMKLNGTANNLLEKIEADAKFGLSHQELEEICDPSKFTGRAAEQTQEYIESSTAPVLEKYRSLIGINVKITK